MLRTSPRRCRQVSHKLRLLACQLCLSDRALRTRSLIHRTSSLSPRLPSASFRRGLLITPSLLPGQTFLKFHLVQFRFHSLCLLHKSTVRVLRLPSLPPSTQTSNTPDKSRWEVVRATVVSAAQPEVENGV